MNVSARFTVKPRRFNGKTFHLACNFCVFPTKKRAAEILEWRKGHGYENMHHRVVELPKSQWFLNFNDESKPLKFAVMEAYKDKKDEPKRGGLRDLFG